MAKLDIGVMVVGYMRAVNRFMTGGDRPRLLLERAVRHRNDPKSDTDPFHDDISISGYFQALFEALDWANSLDNRLRRDWDREWYRAVEGGETIPGIRWARNAVQHQWDGAVYLDEAKAEGLPPRQLHVLWHWMPELNGDKRDRNGRASYLEHLADHVVLISLAELMPVFLNVSVELAKQVVPLGTYTPARRVA